ncbi:MAG: riboflavin synthase [Alphaproteobacteria bacterium]|nr:riboflavin synthase [Alphaproteobacteria bacterium]
MFTGIVTEVGLVRSIRRAAAAADTRLEIAAPHHAGSLALGASIACSGVCLTVVERGDDWFAVEASAETLARTTLGDWAVGTAINLERALRLGDELGGHIVSGHVDGVGMVEAWSPEGGSVRASFSVPRTMGRYLASKGSVAVDGVSLTVNDVEDHGDATRFGVNLIPHTRSETTFRTARVGQRVNVEVDMLARYVDRLKGS